MANQLVRHFESELMEKIQYKASSKISLDAFLFKAFKFFDLYNDGRLGQNDFFKAIAKCGVVVDPENLSPLFAHYALEDGKVSYQNFIQQLLFREEEIESNRSRVSKLSQAPQNNPLLQKTQEVDKISRSGISQKEKLGESKIDTIYSKCQTYAQVLQFIRRTIGSQKMGGLLDLAVRIKSTDPTKTHLTTKHTLSSVATFLAPEHIDIIFNELAGNQHDIDYSVLVYDLKGDVDENRVRDIGSTFAFLDNRGEGQFPIHYLLSSYLSRAEVANFRQAIDLYCAFQGIDDGVFTEDDFNDFMGFVSVAYSTYEAFYRALIRPFYEEDNKSTISNRSNRSREFPSNKSQRIEEQGQPVQPSDFRKNKDSPIHQSEEDFREFREDQPLQTQSQKPSESRHSRVQTRQIPQNQLKEVESVLLRIKRRLASKGSKGFLMFEKALKNADLNRDTLLSYEEFKQVIRDQRIDITPTETSAIFDLFDDQGTGALSFPEFTVVLKGKIPENRKKLTDKLWHQVKLSEEETNFSKLRKTIHFRNHPDVQTGRRYEEDIWKQIQETILMIQELNGVPRSDTISKAEFDEFMQNLSLSIIDEKLFESIIFNFWKLDTSSNILTQYAGSRKMFDSSKNNYLMDHHRYVLQGGSVSQSAPFGTSKEPTNYFTEHRKL